MLRSEVILSGNIGYPLPDGHVFSDSENDCGNWSYELCTGTVTRVYLFDDRRPGTDNKKREQTIRQTRKNTLEQK